MTLNRKRVTLSAFIKMLQSLEKEYGNLPLEQVYVPVPIFLHNLKGGVMTDENIPEGMTLLEGVQEMKKAFDPSERDELAEVFSPGVIDAMSNVYDELEKQELELIIREACP